MNFIDTIFAQATAGGRAGIAVIRISGPNAFPAAAALSGYPPEARRAKLGWLRDPATGDRLDEALTIGFPAPGSFTGEDVVELQLHGSPAVCRSVLAVLARRPGLRRADPGEFTRRALMNGRLDLAQVEGLGDLLAAETAAQHRQALRLMAGALSRRAEEWRQALIGALALVEASVDFADEDLPEDVAAGAADLLAEAAADMRRELAESRMAERLRDGFEVALVGAPNVGKSTLLNTLAGRDAALTSEIAGTTRDVIEVRMDLEGLPVTLLDMAGIRPAGETVEALGIARARQRAGTADLRIFLVDAPGDAAGLGVLPQPGDLTVLAKADLRGACAEPAVSGRTGAGVEALLRALADEFGGRVAGAGTLSHARQREAVERACAAAEAAASRARAAEPQPELLAADIRAALGALDFLAGRVDVEAVLDVIFRSFCLGK